MYAQLKDALEKNGEVMVLTDAGEEHELHLHNVTFKEEPIIKVDASDTVHWLNADKIERYWIHKEF